MAKKPFSAKQKKAQLQAKRAKKDGRDIPNENKTEDLSTTEKLIKSAAINERNAPFLRFANEDDQQVEKNKTESVIPFVTSPKRIIPLEWFLKNEYAIPLPRKPEWEAGMSHEEIQEREERYFLAWLSSIGDLVSHKSIEDKEDSELNEIEIAAKKNKNDQISFSSEMNMFETNLRVYQEFWRVVDDRSDIVAVIVDSRFPLAHCPRSLVDYLDGAGKKWFMVLNKSDLVSSSHIDEWIVFLKSVYPSCCNFIKANSSGKSSPHELARKIADTAILEHPRLETVSIGIVGQPSVGKSSLLNFIMEKRLTRTGRTAGVTKHLQTGYLPLPEDPRRVLLVDCPGLCLPLRGVPRALQIIIGVFPLARTREFYSALRLLVESNPQNFTLEEDDSPLSYLTRICEKRGFYTSHETPFIHRAAIQLFTDVVDGKISYAFPAPSERFEMEPRIEIERMGLEE